MSTVRYEDIEVFKNIGKNYINILELNDGYIHKNDAVKRISKALAAKDQIKFSESLEGKIELRSACRGIVKINTEALNQINEIDEITVATIRTNTMVEEGQLIAAIRVIPLSIHEEKILQLEFIEETLEDKLITIVELKSKKVGVVAAGAEIYESRKIDSFAPVIREKVEHYGCSVMDVRYCPDNLDSIEEAINGMILNGAEVVLVCGEMPVDADNAALRAIKNVAKYVVSYGMPIIPENMLMLAYKGSIAILGISAAAILYKSTSIDIILPRVLADDKITRKDAAAYGHGGLCWDCKVYTYAAYSFEK